MICASIRDSKKHESLQVSLSDGSIREFQVIFSWMCVSDNGGAFQLDQLSIVDKQHESTSCEVNNLLEKRTKWGEFSRREKMIYHYQRKHLRDHLVICRTDSIAYSVDAMLYAIMHKFFISSTNVLCNGHNPFLYYVSLFNDVITRDRIYFRLIQHTHRTIQSTHNRRSRRYRCRQHWYQYLLCFSV